MHLVLHLVLDPLLTVIAEPEEVLQTLLNHRIEGFILEHEREFAEASLHLHRGLAVEHVALLALTDERHDHARGDVTVHVRATELLGRGWEVSIHGVQSLSFSESLESLSSLTSVSRFFRLSFFIFDCFGSGGTMTKPSKRSNASSRDETG